MNTSLLESFVENGEEGIQIVVPDLAVVDQPIHLKLEHPFVKRLRVKAGRSTRLNLILDEHAADGVIDESRLDSEFTLASGACVKVIHIRRGGAKAKRSSKNLYHLGNHSDLEVFTFVNEGALTLSDHVAEFEGEHAFASFKGLSVLKGNSMVQDRLIADHSAAHGTSRQFYKNILAGSARSEFNSLVAVKTGAIKSDSRQLNKNLLLSENARAEARPELRIDADDVSCAHGAAVGRIDKDELFYLRSRGLSESLARYVMTLGFAEEMLTDLEPAGIREELRALVKLRLREALRFSGKGELI